MSDIKTTTVTCVSFVIEVLSQSPNRPNEKSSLSSSK